MMPRFSLFRHSMYHRHVASNFGALFLLALLTRLLFNAIVCSPESIINYTPREVVDKCFSDKRADVEVKTVYMENYDLLWLYFLIVGIVFSLLKQQFNQNESEYMTAKVYYYLFKCILFLTFVIAHFNYKLNLKFLGLAFNWLITNPFTPNLIFQRKFDCDLRRDVPEEHLKFGSTICKLRLNDLYEFIYIWVWILLMFLSFLNAICLIHVILSTVSKRYRLYRLRNLLPTENEANINCLAENLDHFFVIECNSNKTANNLKHLKNSLLDDQKIKRDLESQKDQITEIEENTEGTKKEEQNLNDLKDDFKDTYSESFNEPKESIQLQKINV